MVMIADVIERIVATVIETGTEIVVVTEIGIGIETEIAIETEIGIEIAVAISTGTETAIEIETEMTAAEEGRIQDPLLPLQTLVDVKKISRNRCDKL